MRVNLQGIHKGGKLRCEAVNLAAEVLQVLCEGGSSRRGGKCSKSRLGRSNFENIVSYQGKLIERTGGGK